MMAQLLDPKYLSSVGDTERRKMGGNQTLGIEPLEA
jgi:hypothetical protein